MTKRKVIPLADIAGALVKKLDAGSKLARKVQFRCIECRDTGFTQTPEGLVRCLCRAKNGQQNGGSFF